MVMPGGLLGLGTPDEVGGAEVRVGCCVVVCWVGC